MDFWAQCKFNKNPALYIRFSVCCLPVMELWATCNDMGQSSQHVSWAELRSESRQKGLITPGLIDPVCLRHLANSFTSPCAITRRSPTTVTIATDHSIQAAAWHCEPMKGATDGKTPVHIRNGLKDLLPHLAVSFLLLCILGMPWTSRLPWIHTSIHAKPNYAVSYKTMHRSLHESYQVCERNYNWTHWRLDLDLTCFCTWPNFL